MSDQPFVVPTGPLPPTRKNPHLALFVGRRKVGKTASLAALPNSLLVELQPEGADYVTARKLTREKDIPDKTAFYRLTDYLYNERREGRDVAPRVIYDGLTYLEDWIFEQALEDFKATPAGKSPTYADLFDVTLLPGNPGSQGWAWVRQAWRDMFLRLKRTAREVVIVGNLPDKSRYVDANNPNTSQEDVDVTGKVARQLICGEAALIGHLRRNGANELVLNCRTNDSVTCGSYCKHLAGHEFIVGRPGKDGADPTFDWSEVYLEDS